MLAISLYSSRLVLKYLGVVDYGIYNIVGGVVSLFVFLNNAMTTSTQRFISYYIGRGFFDKLQKLFSISLLAHFVIVLVVLLLSETIGLWFLNNYLNIPIEKIGEANWVYQFSICTLCAQILTVPYSANIIAQEKMSLYAYLSIIESLLKLFSVIVLCFINGSHLVYYSFFILISNSVILLSYYCSCVRKYDYCHYIKYWNKKMFKDLLSFSSWSLLGQTMVVVSGQGCNILLNMFFGVAMNAAMGIAMQVNSALMGFVYNFQTAFKPQIIKVYAGQDFGGLYKLISYSSRLSFFLLYVFSIPLCFYIDEILKWWLEIVPAHTANFCILIIVYSLFEAMAAPLWISIFATAQIGKYQIYVSSAFFSVLIISLFFLILGYPPEVVLLVRIFVSVIVLFIRIWFAKKKVGLHEMFYFTDALFPIVKVVFITLPVLYCVFAHVEYNFFGNIFILFVTNLLLVAILGIKRNELVMLISIIKNKLNINGNKRTINS